MVRRVPGRRQQVQRGAHSHVTEGAIFLNYLINFATARQREILALALPWKTQLWGT